MTGNIKNTLHTFSRFPISICTQDTPLTEEERLVEASIVEDEIGMVHFLPYVDPREIYLNQHNSCVGKTWTLHNEEFANFVLQYEKDSIVEIAGGAGKVFQNFVKNNPDYTYWKVVDINPSNIYQEDPRCIVKHGLFEPEEDVQEGDTVISSHFVEHVYHLEEFLKDLHSRNPKYHIFTLPNFKKFAASNYTATIMFEHPHYLAEDCLDYLLALTGWKIKEKKFFLDHSIFYITEPCIPEERETTFTSAPDINNLITYMQQRVASLPDSKFYVFGAHLTYYYLLNLGVPEDKIIAVVDNDPNKQGRRMYGTNTKVISPSELPKNALVFLEMGPYNQEIANNLIDVILL